MNSSVELQPYPYYFISYSRQEVAFVDSFSQELEKRGVHTWVDFRNLIPGAPWQEQLDEGVRNSAGILLIVSKASMSSNPVKDEIKKTIDADKRIVLIIYEYCKIDSRLEGREWLRFAEEDFNHEMNLLIEVLSKPERRKVESPPEKPEADLPSLWWNAKLYGLRGIRSYPIDLLLSLIGLLIFGKRNMPKEAKQFLLLGLFVIPFSLMALLGVASITDVSTTTGSTALQFWELLAVLVFLPASWNLIQSFWRMRTRTHNAPKLRNSVIGFLLINVLGIVFGPSSAFSCFAMVGLLGSFYLLRLLSSAAIYRWAGATGALIRPAQPQLTSSTNARAMSVALEFAPQDIAYAQALKASIQKAGHICIDNLQEADIVLPLISVYQNTSSCNPEEKLLIPVLLQSSDVCQIDPRLSKVQWVDLRYGQASMDAVAHMLDKPEELLRTLGILPVRNPILPGRVNLLVNMVSFIATYSVWIIVVYVIWNYLDISSPRPPYLLLILFTTGIHLLKSYLIKRKFWLVKTRAKLLETWNQALNRKLGTIEFSYTWALGFAVLLSVIATIAYKDAPYLSFPVWLVVPLMLFKEIRMWLPARVKADSVSAAKGNTMLEDNMGEPQG